mmetsp:Transcript_35827/g.98718  ORF Transcript_35827/g.98718 Transcript_35827/m.98718 type:complete len:275 (-) Transcript_35827:1489-2313(-)
MPRILPLSIIRALFRLSVAALAQLAAVAWEAPDARGDGAGAGDARAQTILEAGYDGSAADIDVFEHRQEELPSGMSEVRRQIPRNFCEGVHRLFAVLFFVLLKFVVGVIVPGHQDGDKHVFHHEVKKHRKDVEENRGHRWVRLLQIFVNGITDEHAKDLDERQDKAPHLDVARAESEICEVYETGHDHQEHCEEVEEVVHSNIQHLDDQSEIALQLGELHDHAERDDEQIDSNDEFLLLESDREVFKVRINPCHLFRIVELCQYVVVTKDFHAL